MKPNLPVLITARLGSSRLPQKHLLPLAADKSSIACVLDRLQSTALRLVLCIPAGEEDAPLRRLAAEARIEWFGGDTENVLRRYSQAMAHFAIPAAIIVDADDVFVSTEAIARIFQLYAGEDVIRCSDMAYGGAPYLLSRIFVDAMLAQGASPHGWSGFLDRLPGNKLTLGEFAVAADEQAYRLSLDYPEDFEYLTFLYRQLGPRASHADIVAHITANKAALGRRFPRLFDGSVAAQARQHIANSTTPSAP